jgi:hypothetical protein
VRRLYNQEISNKFARRLQSNQEVLATSADGSAGSWHQAIGREREQLPLLLEPEVSMPKHPQHALHQLAHLIRSYFGTLVLCLLQGFLWEPI